MANQTAQQIETGFENMPDTELAREWEQLMRYSTLDGILSSIRFLRICQELDKRKIGPHKIGHLLASTNEQD